MKLQIAVDITDTARILEIAKGIYDIIDIFEIGTPAIIKEGLSPVRKLKEKYPDLCVLADSKIVDGGKIEAQNICESGADIMTVLAFADNTTIAEVVETAHAYGRKVLADLICIKNIRGRSTELIDLGIDYIGVHTGVDMQKSGRTPIGDLHELLASVPRNMVAVAGGIGIKTLHSYVIQKPEIIIAGSALYSAPDIRTAVLNMKEAMK